MRISPIFSKRIASIRSLRSTRSGLLSSQMKYASLSTSFSIVLVTPSLIFSWLTSGLKSRKRVASCSSNLNPAVQKTTEG